MTRSPAQDVNVLAIAAQISILAFFYAAFIIRLHTSLQEADAYMQTSLAWRVLGVRSAVDSAIFIVSTNLLALTIFVAMTTYQVSINRDTNCLRIVESNQLPELTLGKHMKYHLFLSHVWSSGQDQAATIKRQLQLLLPGVSVFLDVDDLQEIGDRNLQRLKPSAELVLFC